MKSMTLGVEGWTVRVMSRTVRTCGLNAKGIGCVWRDAVIKLRRKSVADDAYEKRH
jgi:hypothetical protein